MLPYNFVEKNNIYKYTTFCSNIFLLNHNIIFIDVNLNLNYLPCTNKAILSKSPKKFYQFLKFFNVSVVIFLNLKKKKSLFKKFLNYRLLNVAANNSIRGMEVDLHLRLPNSYLVNYIIYIHTMYIYLKLKN